MTTRPKPLHAILFIPLSLYQASNEGVWPSDVQLRIGAADCSQGLDFDAQVAQTDEQQRQGLSGRAQPLEPDEAMVFVWNQAEPRSFWMAGTLIPLTLLYFGADSRLATSLEMSVEPDPANPQIKYPSPLPALAALEIAGGNASRFSPGAEICVQLP